MLGCRETTIYGLKSVNEEVQAVGSSTAPAQIQTNVQKNELR